MPIKQPSDLITTSEARVLIDVSAVTMARLIRDEIIRTFPDPLDRRVKLVSRAEVLALKVRRAA
jgi:hypothetical protein